MAGFKPRPLISEASALATESQPTTNDDYGAFFFKTSGVRRDHSVNRATTIASTYLFTVSLAEKLNGYCPHPLMSLAV